jgi:hypothetical protein
MPTEKYKIVYTDHAGVLETPEIVTFTCACPVAAVKAYVAALMADDHNLVTIDVFPVVDEPKPLFTATAAVESTLFNGYAVPAKKVKAKAASGPKSEKFTTPDSTWISHVSWEAANSSICVNFLNGGYIVYKSDYATFCNYKTWVGIGNSAGAYYNSNIKGLEVLKHKV